MPNAKIPERDIIEDMGPGRTFWTVAMEHALKAGAPVERWGDGLVFKNGYDCTIECSVMDEHVIVEWSAHDYS